MRRLLHHVIQEIFKVKNKTKEADKATKVKLAKTVEVEVQIEAAKEKKDMLDKTNKLLQEYSLALVQAIKVVLARTTEVDKELEAIKEKIAKINGITNPPLKEKSPKIQKSGIDMSLTKKSRVEN